MALVPFIRRWLDSVVNNFRCGLYGHSDVVVLERYEPLYRDKIFKGSSLENLTRTVVRRDKIWIEKCHCRGCGETYLRKRKEPVQLWQ